METTNEKVNSVPTVLKKALKDYLVSGKSELETQLMKTPVIVYYKREDYQFPIRSVDELNEIINTL